MPSAEILADVRDKRLRIIRSDRRLIAPDHREFAWKHVRGEYVRSIEDMYIDRNVPWVDDPSFVAELNRLGSARVRCGDVCLP